MLKIRLLKRGRKNAPSYRIVVAEASAPRDGKHIEVIGFYNPSYNPVLFKYDKERYEYWISKGAQPTDSVKSLIAGKYEFKKYNPKEEKEGEKEVATTEEGNPENSKGQPEKDQGNQEQPKEE